MKFLNFRLADTTLATGNQTFELHHHFTLQRYTYDTRQRQFAVTLQGVVSWPTSEVQHWLTTELKLLFRQVTFLRIQDAPFDEANVCLVRMQFVSELAHKAGLVLQVEQLFATDEFDPAQWSNYLYLSFLWGVEILIAAETAEVQFHPWNGLEVRGET